MIRIYRHSELIDVTHNRGKRDREHMPEFVSLLFSNRKKEKTMQWSNENNKIGQLSKKNVNRDLRTVGFDRSQSRVTLDKVKVGLKFTERGPTKYQTLPHTTTHYQTFENFCF